MRQRKTDILFYLGKLPLFVLYISFFIVQLFYNFDTGVQQLVITAPLFQKAKIAGANTSVSKAFPGSGTSKGHFRLNKRYHPQPAITCSTVVFKPLVCVVSSKLHIHYSSGYIPSFFTAVHKLRGPPVVTC